MILYYNCLFLNSRCEYLFSLKSIIKKINLYVSKIEFIINVRKIILVFYHFTLTLIMIIFNTLFIEIISFLFTFYLNILLNICNLYPRNILVECNKIIGLNIDYSKISIQLIYL